MQRALVRLVSRSRLALSLPVGGSRACCDQRASSNLPPGPTLGSRGFCVWFPRTPHGEGGASHTAEGVGRATEPGTVPKAGLRVDLRTGWPVYLFRSISRG